MATTRRTRPGAAKETRAASSASAKRPTTEKEFKRWARSKLAEVKRAPVGEPDRVDRRLRNKLFTEYFRCLMLEGPVLEARIKTIERFVQLQCLPHEGARYIISYHSPLFPNVDLWVSEWADLDFADLESIVSTHVMEVERLDASRWTPTRIKKFMEHLEGDFDYDGVEVRLDACTADYSDAVLEVQGDWEGED